MISRIERHQVNEWLQLDAMKQMQAPREQTLQNKDERKKNTTNALKLKHNGNEKFLIRE